VDGGRVDGGVGVEVERADRLVAREAGGLDPPLGAAPGPVVALGHQQFGQEPAVGHLVVGGGLGQLGVLGADGGQVQQPAGLVDGGAGGLLGQSAVALDGHGASSWRAGGFAGCLRNRSSWS
jgi:hypothetical protein